MESSTHTGEAIGATVFIPTFNAGELLDGVLQSVREQEFDHQFEILIIDSGSTDQTLHCIGQHAEQDRRIRLHQIPNHEFQHGRTRNLAVTMARGRYVAFLTQDAQPASKRWLEYLLEPFALSEQIKGVTGKQVPRSDADTTTRREIISVFDSLGPEHSIMIHRSTGLESGREVEPALGFYSDVNSAAPRIYLLANPYEDVNYAEDQLFGAAILDAGLCKAYAPRAAVLHSNQYALPDYFARKVDEFSGLHDVFGHRPEHRIRKGIRDAGRSSRDDIAFAIRDTGQKRRLRLRGALLAPVRQGLWNAARVAVGRSPERSKSRHSLERRIRDQSK